MRFEVLGQTRAIDGGEQIEQGGRQQHLVLALLVMYANEVSINHLVGSPQPWPYD